MKERHAIVERPPTTGMERNGPLMEAGYLPHRGEQLYYTVLSPTTHPRACAVLAGPFASARHGTYVNWTHWAESLALSGIEALRFDYRGHGESTGRFEDTAFQDWLEDLECCIAWLRKRRPGSPLLLHGLQLGALLAGRVFEKGVGDALLLWSPPKSAKSMLFELLRHRLASDFAEGRPARVRDDCVADLEIGRSVEVDGYLWTQKLWMSACAFPEGAVGGVSCVRDADCESRPQLVLKLGRLPLDEADVFDPISWVNIGEPKPSSARVFRVSLEWLNGAVPSAGEACEKSSNTG